VGFFQPSGIRNRRGFFGEAAIQYKINLPGNITIPTLIAEAGSSQLYVFSEDDNIFFEAEIFLNSYDVANIILASISFDFGIVNEYAFLISDIGGLDGRTPTGSVNVYNGARGDSLSLYYTETEIVNLSEWTKIVANRIGGNWSISINDVECSVSRHTDAGVPNDVFGNNDLPVHVGTNILSEENFDGQIRNLFLR
jgi:hypothetical protein